MTSIEKQASLFVALAVLAGCGSGSGNGGGGITVDGTQQPKADTCAEGAACAAANPCHLGKMSCAASACVDTGTALADGSACGTGFLCASGACVAACLPAQLCDPGDACRIGATTCTAPWSAPSCLPAGLKPDGTACGADRTCSAGSCVTPSTVARVWVDDAVAPVDGTATLRATVTLGSGNPTQEVDWWTDGCLGAWVEPTRGVSTTFHAPPCPGCSTWQSRTKCRVRAVSVADPTKSDTAYVIVGGGTREVIPTGPAPWGIAAYRAAGGSHQVLLAVASTGSGNVQHFGVTDDRYSSWPVGANPRGDMAVDDSMTPTDPSFHVWISVTGENKVARVGFDTLERFDVGSLPHGVAMAGAEVWVANYGASTLTKLDRSTGATLGTYPIGAWGLAPTGIAYDGSTLWVSTATAVLNLTTAGQLIRSITPVADPYGIIYDLVTGYVWFANHGSNTVVRVTPGTGATATFTVGNAPIGLAWTGERTLWVTNSGDDTVSELRQSDGTIVATLKTGPMPFGVAYDDLWGQWALWVTSYGGSDVRRLF